MKSRQLLAGKSVVAMLGVLGRGTAFSKANFVVETNGSPQGPDTHLSFDSAALICKTSGNVLVYTQMSVTASNVDDAIGAELRVDGTPGLPGAFTTAGHVTAQCEISIGWIVTGLTLGGSGHTFGIDVVDNTSPHTISNIAGAAIVVAIELP